MKLDVLAFAFTLAVQAPQASVQGVVRAVDTGEPLAGAPVVLGDLGRGVLTDTLGRYEILSVPAGPQHLTVGQLGYGTRTLHILVPRSGRLEFNVSLRPSAIELEGLVVAPIRPVRGLDPGDSTAFPDRGLTHAGLLNHPTLAQPDPLKALAGGEVVVEPEAPTGLHIRGGAAEHTGYLIDGIPVLNPYHTAGLFAAWNPDALSGLRLVGAAPSPALPDALSGVVAARTREPGRRVRMQSTFSNAEARITLDGPAGVGGAGYLVSWRSGFPGALSPQDEASYLSGETGDFLGKIQVPLLGGGLRVLIYDSENEIGAASTVPEDGAPSQGGSRNTFGWTSRSIGARWNWGEGDFSAAASRDEESARGEPALSVRLGVWRADADAGSSWNVSGDPAQLTSQRRDYGLHASLERRSGRTASEVGARFRSMTTAYHIRAQRSPTTWDVGGSSDVATLFLQHSRPLGGSIDAWAGVAASHAAGEFHVAPRARLRWRSGDRLIWTAAYSRAHQFSQSLRNAESVVGHVFPADLFLGAGVADVPVPRSDQFVVAGEWSPLAGARVGAQAFWRRMENLVLVAPHESGPFATASFALGRSDARGVSVEFAANGARYGVVASYGWQRVRTQLRDSAYTPRHGTSHAADAGMVLFPTPTSSLRVAISAATGRTATALSGPFEWEACNILDQGCEFAGSPGLAGPLGGSELPAYVRLDLGARKHWHVSLRGRDVLVGVFGTLANVLGRDNALAYVVDPETGERQTVHMLPRSPLVIGVDLRF